MVCEANEAELGSRNIYRK